jgi:hypothetical protein
LKFNKPYKIQNAKDSLLCRLSFVILVLHIFFSCTKTKDQILAKVYNEQLRLSQVEGVVPKGTPATDSIIMLNTYVEQWVREKLFEHDAEIRLPDKEKIEKQVEKYRTSLINFAYEEFLIKQQLDTIVGDDTLKSFYDQNKEQFLLETSIIKCNFIKIPKARIKNVPIDDYWKSNSKEDKKQLIDFCRDNATLFMLEDTLWYNLEEIYFQLPKGKIDRSAISSGKQWITEDAENKYYLKIIKMVPVGELAPISYARTQITKILNYKKKKELIDKIKDDILDRESRKSNFKIYTNRSTVNTQNK